MRLFNTIYTYLRYMLVGAVCDKPLGVISSHSTDSARAEDEDRWDDDISLYHRKEHCMIPVCGSRFTQFTSELAHAKPVCVQCELPSQVSIVYNPSGRKTHQKPHSALWLGYDDASDIIQIIAGLSFSAKYCTRYMDEHKLKAIKRECI